MPSPSSHRRPSLRAAALASLAAFAGLACGAADGAPPVEAAPPADELLVFQRDGIPGPWWRRGATHEMFDAEHRICLVRSQEARSVARDGDPADAAYRAFLECMERQQWSRGLPPRAKT